MPGGAQQQDGRGAQRTAPELSCGCCGAPLLPVRPYRANTAPGRALFGGSRLCQCQGCGLAWVAPLPSPAALTAYYERDYRAAGRYGAAATCLQDFPLDNAFFDARGRSIAELAARYAPTETSRILDVGAGFGHLLHALGERFPSALRTAIELSSACRPHLESLSIRVLAEPAERALEREQWTFDLVTLSHVLEHLRDPLGTLAAIRRHLSPEGILYAEVPHIPPGSLTKYPDHLLVPRHDEPHLTFFHAGALRALLEQSGYRVLFLDTAGPAYRYVSALAFRLPQPRWLADRLLPRSFLRAVRQLPFLSRAKFSPDQPEFSAYGGDRIWLRAVARPLP